MGSFSAESDGVRCDMKESQLDRDTSLREHLLYLLRRGGAHLGFEEAVRAFQLYGFDQVAE